MNKSNIQNESKNLRQDLQCITNVEVVKQLVSIAGRTVVDIGCGSMTFTKHLVDLGANVIAIDPDPVQAEKNRQAPEVLAGKIQFKESRAEQLPFADASLDGVFFSYSLHHIPASSYENVFSEVARVLRPDGFLYVIEPIDCPLNQVMKMFHDEDIERAAAQHALQTIAKPKFSHCTEVSYHGYSQYDSFEHFADHFSNRSFNSTYNEDDVRREEVRTAFEKLGGSDHRFQSPKMAMFLHQLI